MKKILFVLFLAACFTFQMYENQAIVIQKEKDDEVYAGSADAHFTKIAYPRG